MGIPRTHEDMRVQLKATDTLYHRYFSTVDPRTT